MITDDFVFEPSVAPSTVATTTYKQKSAVTGFTKTSQQGGSPYKVKNKDVAEQPTTWTFSVLNESQSVLTEPGPKVDESLTRSDNHNDRMCELDPMVVGMEFILT